VLMGDADNDGAYDVFDSCPTTSNSEQLDSDLDGLGDDCDPNKYCSDFTPSSPPAAPAAARTCQSGLGGAARAYLKKRANATRACLNRLAGGSTDGDPM